jgi:hypothetical protein
MSPLSPALALGASCCIAAAFVGLLYAIPERVRRLPRDNAEHVSTAVSLKHTM